MDGYCLQSIKRQIGAPLLQAFRTSYSHSAIQWVQERWSLLSPSKSGRAFSAFMLCCTSGWWYGCVHSAWFPRTHRADRSRLHQKSPAGILLPTLRYPHARYASSPLRQTHPADSPVLKRSSSFRVFPIGIILPLAYFPDFSGSASIYGTAHRQVSSFLVLLFSVFCAVHGDPTVRFPHIR